MQNIKVSLSNNILKVSTIENGEFKGVSADVAKEVVNDYEILNTTEFSSILKDLINTVTKKSVKSLTVDFIIEPQDTILKFVTVNKRDGNIEDQIVNEIRTRVKEVPLEDLYFSYLKIAPFVYQFIGIKKEILEKLLEISNTIGISMRSVIPWVLLLPKFVSINEPAVFLSRTSGKQIVALSEFNGLFFSGVYEKDKSTEELQKLVKDLSVYKRIKPINKVYVYNCDSFSLNPEYEVIDLKIPNTDLPEAQGYDIHLLVDYVIDNDPNLLYSQKNLVNILPALAVPEKKNTSLVYVGAVLGVLLVLGGIIAGASFVRNRNLAKAVQSAEQNQVLSNTVNKPETSPSANTQTPPAEVLKKEDIVIKVENGAGIPGIAGKTQTYLTGLGYKVSSIGNAAESGRTTTLVKTKTDKAKYQDLLKKDLEKSFTVTVETGLDSGVDYDVLIVVGTDAKL